MTASTLVTRLTRLAPRGIKVLPLLLLLVLPAKSSQAVEWLDALPVVGKGDDASTTSAVSATTLANTAAQPPRIHEARQAMVRILDKQTNRVQQQMVNVKQPKVMGTLTVTVNRCLLDSHGHAGLDAGWLDITDTAFPDKGYSGWMFSRYPAAATLENPRYDVQLTTCVLPSGEQRVQNVAPPAGAGQGTGGADVEGGGDDEAPAGGGGGATSATAPQEGHSNDPFYVPGVGGGGTATAAPSQPEKAEQPDEPAANNDDEPAPADENADHGVELPTERAPEHTGADHQELQRMMDTNNGQ